MADPVEISVLDQKVRLLQPDQGFRTALDSVMLAAACPATEGQRVLDMGCGVGGAAFCLLQRVPGVYVAGVEVQPEYVDLAETNIALNHCEGRVSFLCQDIRDFEVGGPDQRFDHVICNPPYMEAGRHLRSPHESKARAHGHHDEEDMKLQDWLDAGFQLLKPGGSFTIIHRADSTDRIIFGLGRRFGAVEIIPLWPRAGAAAKRVIVRALKDRKSPAVLHAGLVLHQEDGSYTAQADEILRKAQPIR